MHCSTNFPKVAIQTSLEMFERVDRSNTVSSVFWGSHAGILPISDGVWGIGAYCGYYMMTFVADISGPIMFGKLPLDAQSTKCFCTNTGLLAKLATSMSNGTFGWTSIIPSDGIICLCQRTVSVV